MFDGIVFIEVLKAKVGRWKKKGTSECVKC